MVSVGGGKRAPICLATAGTATAVVERRRSRFSPRSKEYIPPNLQWGGWRGKGAAKVCVSPASTNQPLQDGISQLHPTGHEVVIGIYGKLF